MKSLKLKSCLIDGEIAVCDQRGLAVFDRLRYGPRINTRAALYAFDLIELDGEDLRDVPIERRKRDLKRIVRSAGAAGLQLADHDHGDGADIFAAACRLGSEGIVSKRLGSRYVSGRCEVWLKIKNPAAPAVRREAEENWSSQGTRSATMISTRRVKQYLTIADQKISIRLEDDFWNALKAIAKQHGIT